MDQHAKRGYLNSDFRIFHLTECKSQEFEYHYHDFNKITIFIQGNVQYFVEGKSYQLKPYDIVLISRNDMHKIVVDDSVPYERIIIYISPAFMDAYKTDEYDLCYCFHKAKKEQTHVLRIHAMKKSPLFATTSLLERCFSDTGYGVTLYRQVLFLEFMIHLNRAALEDHLEFLTTDLYNEKVVLMLQYINDHLTEDLDIDLLSKKAFISRYYMMRMFKAETGYTISSYIRYRRLLLAREMIADGTPITEACYNCGFKDYSTFSRAYKSAFGKTPRET